MRPRAAPWIAMRNMAEQVRIETDGCPKCGARPGSPCTTTKRGKLLPRGPHAARGLGIRAWDAPRKGPTKR